LFKKHYLSLFKLLYVHNPCKKRVTINESLITILSSIYPTISKNRIDKFYQVADCAIRGQYSTILCVFSKAFKLLFLNFLTFSIIMKKVVRTFSSVKNDSETSPMLVTIRSLSSYLKQTLCFSLGTRLILLSLLFSLKTFGQTALPVSSGFNIDAIAESQPATSYSTSIDLTDHAFHSMSYKSTAYGFPDSRMINLNGVPYELASYAGNNAAIVYSGSSVTLNVATPKALTDIYILASATEGSGTASISVNFTDGTNEVLGSASVPDWVVGSGGYGVGYQLRRTSNAFESGSTKVYGVSYTISAGNRSKILNSVTVTNGGSARFLVFALGSSTPACVTPTAYTVTGGGSYCSGGTGVTVGLSGSETGVTYQLQVGGTNTGSPVSGTNAAITFGNQTTAGIYTVVATRTAGSCTANMTGSPTVSIISTPDVNTISNQVVCNNASTTAVSFSGSVAGTVYNWTNNTTSIGLAASGSGNISAFTATNTGTAPVTATITVTPSYTSSGVTCTGTAQTFTVTVNPTATVNTVSNQVVCNNASTTAVTFGSPTTGGTIVYNWTNNTPSIGLAASGSGNIAAFTATNSSTAPVTATITVTPAYTNGGVTCTGTAKTFTIIVNPTAIVNTVSNQVVCHNSSTAAVSFSSPTTGGSIVYNWTNNTTSIGLAASGTGNIAAFTATNPTDVAVVATITVTPSYTNAGVTCTGTPRTFNITVNPLPRITRVTPQAPVCQFDSDGNIALTVAGGTPPNTYNWALVGRNFTATTTVPTLTGITSGTYNITLTDINGCQAFASTYVSTYLVAAITAPPIVILNANQILNGTVLPTVSGELIIGTRCFTPKRVVYTDKVYEVRCGIVVDTSGNPVNIGYDPTIAPDAVRFIIRTFTATSAFDVSYSTFQEIYIRSYKLSEINVPSNRTLPCANSSTDPSVNGTPSVDGRALGQGLANNLSATYVDVRVTNPNGFTIQRTWTLKENCTNATRTVVQNLTYTVGTCPATMMSISGKIAREDALEIPTNIVLSYSNNEVLTTTISAATYSFNNLLSNTAFRVKPTRPNTDWNSGVTMLDVALIGKHLLDIQSFNSPYKIIAADINADGSVDALDMLLAQRLILRINSNFPNNNSWRFVIKNYQFQDPNNPLASDFPELLVVSNLTNSIANGDFVALKVGDVNQSFGNVTIRGANDPFVLSVDDKVLEKNKTYTIPIQMTPSVTAFQYALTLDKNAVKLEGLTKGDLPNSSDNNFGLFKTDNTITAAWSSNPTQKLSTTDNFTLVNLSITAKETVRLSEILSFNSVYTEGVAYDERGNGKTIKLSFGNAAKVSEGVALYQNHPNPFSDETTISFNLPEATQVHLSIASIDGKLVKEIKGDFKAGLNTVVVKKSDLQTSGVFYYRLETADFSATKKMVIME
jgi:Dockerin type I domain/Secretion system C-terminal sorting domain